MRSETLVLASLLLCGSSTTLAAPSFDHSKSFQPRRDQDNYVRAEGLKLMNQDKEYFVAGMNYYGCM